MVFLFKSGVLSLITLRYFLVAGPFAIIVAHTFEFLEEQNKNTKQVNNLPRFCKDQDWFAVYDEK